MNVLQLMESTGIVPVFYSGDAAVARNVVGACYRGGMRVFEFTNRGPAAGKVFAELVDFVAVECPELELGVGSIVDGQTCRRFVEAGARFVVGPVFAAEVLDVCRESGVPYIPGAATPTEIFNASRACAEGGGLSAVYDTATDGEAAGEPVRSVAMVKVFPGAELGGPSFVRSVLAPMPWLRLMVTGGVEPTAESLGAWFGAGVKCVGIGSNLFPRELVAAGRWDDIAAICARALASVKN